MPRAVSGPWSRWVRDWADVIRASFLIGAVVLAVLGHGGGALRLFLTFLVALVPRLIGCAWPFDLVFGAAMSLQAWGNVSRVFYTWLGYHDIVHFLLTGATAILVYFLLVFLRLVPDLSEDTHARQRAGIATLTFAIGTVVNAIYECYEWFVDHELHGHLLENYHHTMFDLFFGGLGSVAAGLAMAVWATRKWAFRREEAEGPLAGLRGRIERRADRSVAGGSPRAVRRLLRNPGWGRGAVALSDLARISLVVGFALAAAAGNSDQMVRFGVSLLVSLLARRLAAPGPFELCFNGGLLFEAWGAYATAYHGLPGYDAWANFALSLGSTPIVYLALIRWGVFPEFGREARVHRRVALFVAAMCLGFCCGIYYEEYVWLANHYLGANMPTSWTGVIRRLALDWAGSCAGAVALILWDFCGLGSVRREAVSRAGVDGIRPGRASTIRV